MFERPGRLILKIDEVTISASLPTGMLSTTKRITLFKFWNKFRKI